MSELLKGKVAIVTGAGRGLGRCHALALAQAGAGVVVNDLGGSDIGTGSDPGPAEAVAAEIRAAGGKAIANTASVADWDSSKLIVDAALKHFGRLDIVVNNAGISRFGTPIEATGRADWDLTIAVNLTGSAALTHWAAQHWKTQGPAAGRAIVNTSSPAGTNPLPGSAAYCVSKAGICALTITSAAELAPLGVRVNAIAPIARTRLTEAVPMLADILRKPETGFDRIAPEHVSPLVTYLVSRACQFTGRVFGIEGDDIYLFSGFSAVDQVNNSKRQWSVDSIRGALQSVDQHDRGFMIAPGTRVPAVQPSEETLELLLKIVDRT
jgi:NAD(P)-dependent dehydrogenase (short-subunit alcohol dehydrogenase family)